MHLLGDAMFVMPSFAFADLHARAGGRVWMYEFNLVPSDPRRGALHAADQVFFFGTWDSPGARELLGTPHSANIADSWRALSTHMRQRLIRFAHSGDPALEGAPDWPQFTAARPALLSLDSTSRVVLDPHRNRWDWWRREIIEPGLGQGQKIGQPQ
jgi:para-nitrobenzyl esterase